LTNVSKGYWQFYNKPISENQTISGINTEDSEIGEGVIRFNIIPKEQRF